MSQPKPISPAKIVVESVRVESDDDKRLAALFDKFDQESLESLEKGAREFVQLVTLFLTLIFGILALGGETAAAPLRLPWVILPAAASLLAFLITLIAALDVIVPRGYPLRKQSLSDREQAWARMVQHKREGLAAAAISFGVGITAFVALLGVLLYMRWAG